MEIFKILVLSVIQGIAEFLPISSSGHLAIASKLLGINDDTVFLAVVLHAGSLVSILAVYYREIISLFTRAKRRILPLIVLATIPIGISGLIMHYLKITDSLFTNLLFSGGGLILTGVILLLGMKEEEAQTTALGEMTLKDALVIGLMQCIALLPGVSRSGTTIATALRRNIKRPDAATFSFLIAIPAIAGASFVKIASYLYNIVKNGVPVERVSPVSMLIGFSISAVVGYFALKILIASVKKGKFAPYAYYCLTLGTTVIIWQIWDILN
jgi:undecaprenyl-diphosphatase